jgi:hypothetical protein
MDIGKSFAFVFEDKDWIVKILIAAAILLLGILFSWLLLIPLIVAGALLSGYGVEITRRVIKGTIDGLPEWDDWGGLFKDGLMVLIIGVVYALPMIIVSMCLGIPIGAFAEDASELSSVLSFFLSCLSFLYAIAISIVLPAAIAAYADEDDLSAAFRFGEIFGLVRDNLSTYLITFVMSWVAGLIGGLGAVLCGVGWLFTVPYSEMVIGHLYGQAYLEAKGRALQPAVADVEEAA